MYRISIEDREYAKYRIIDNKTGLKLKDGIVEPVKNKLMNFDTFDIVEGNIELRNSSVRETSIAGVLVLDGNKTYGKIKERFLYKFVPDDKRLPIFLVPYKIKTNFVKLNKNRYMIIYFNDWKDKHSFVQEKNYIEYD